MEDTLTLREAYAAMYAYLERLYEVTGSDELGGLLGGMSLLGDGTTADPAAWDDWMKAVRKARTGAVDMDLHLKKD
ncbi:hypothetical protein JRI60_34030 [Archangium violaceum]|uniref:hypothetical protein n=1 Tax=Archangium violaceum TaxID=83451 RepID=UPI0019515E71|nr:hypothetical protein [Archangium violaceum]QRN94139.1 hypothetical protein JRI60_34030 [Archangium violaceum]